MKISAFSLLFIVCSTIAQNPALSPYEQRDLQLFTTYQAEPGLIAAIDRTSTSMGKQYLTEQLAHPLVSTNSLLERQ